MLKMALKISLLLVILLVPLYIISQYEDYKLKAKDAEDAEDIRNGLESARKHLQTRKANNKRQLQIFNDIMQNEFKHDQRILEEIKSTIQFIFQSPMTMNKLQSYYESNLILNVQITSGFISKINIIKDVIMWQLSWISQFFGMKIIVTEWKEDMNINDIKSGLIVVFRQLRSEYIDQNIALKLRKGDYRSPYYIKQIAQQLRGLSSFSHCKFTSRQCKQSSIVFVKHSDQRQDSFWEVDEQIYFLDEISQKIIFNILSSIFQTNHYLQLYKMTKSTQISRSLFHIMKQKRLIQQLELSLAYLNHTIKETDFNLNVFEEKLQRNVQQAVKYIQNGQFVSPYIHTAEQISTINQFLNQFAYSDTNHSELLHHNIIDDSSIGIIDTFPNDFKIGVYLPLLVIFLYPCILKIKQIIFALFSIFRRNSRNSKAKND